jgi:long-chain fatty acid transport protein
VCKSLRAILAAITAGCLLYSDVQAGGICLYEISSADTRLASAGWSARANDPSTLFTNPAGMTRLCGKQVEFGAQAIFSHVHFDPDCETTVEGSDGGANIWLPSGSFFYIHPYNESLTFGVGTLGYFGADLVYEHDWVGRYYVQKALLEGLSFVPAAAYKINQQWSVGIGANVMYGFLKQRAAVHNILDDRHDGYFSMHDYLFSCGGLFGILYEPTCDTRFGLQYLTPVKLNFRTQPKFSNIGPLLEDVLEKTGIIGSKVKLDIEVPQSLMFSAYHDINTCWSIMANIGWQQWSRFQRSSITLADVDRRSLSFKEHYQDTWHAAIGAEWHYSSCLTFSSGVAYDSSAVSNANRPLNFPVGHQWRVGTGARWHVSHHLIVDLSSEIQWQGDLKADVDKGIVAGHVSGTFKNPYAIFLNSNITYLF